MMIKPNILIRSGWQTVNIGDIAHTPGLFAMLEKHIPEAEISFLPTALTPEVEIMLLRRFPKVNILRTPEDSARAFAECDFLLHGSGGGLVGWRDVLKWHQETGKPFGAYGIGFYATRPAAGSEEPDIAALLSKADFVYFRESVSLERARRQGCVSPVMEFGPDAAFATDLRNDRRAVDFLKQHQLEEGGYLCCIPRLRYTPYWLMKEEAPLHPERQQRNEAMKEHDHAPLREAITQVVRQTGLKILLCPEDSSQMAVGEEMILRKLPEDVAERVVWRRDFWLTDEALSVFVRSAGLFGNEMHSPIMCIGNGIPAIVCRWAEQNKKGLMWKDIGLDEWLFDFDREEEVRKLPETVLALATNPAEAAEKAAQARTFVEKRQREAMEVLLQSLARI